MPPGRYRLAFWVNGYEYRWAVGQTDPALATVYDAPDGGAVQIDDHFGPTGAVEVQPDVTHLPKYVGVTVVPDETTAVTVPLQGTRSVVTSAVDAKTGAPLGGVCLRAVVPGAPVSRGNPVACREADGRIAWRAEPGAPAPCWYDRQPSFEAATTYPIPVASTRTVILTACA